MNLKDRMKSDIPNQTLSESETIQQMSETIENQNIRIQQLSSEKLELTSVIADLRAELSSVQKINQSLTTNNQLLVKQNDDLRNNAGLVSRKEQEKLAKELTNTRGLLSEARKKINMSNVEAVEAAQATQKAAEQKAAKEIAEYKASADKRIADAINAKNTVIKQAKDKVKATEKSRQIAWGSLIATLFCCLIVHPLFLEDIWYFISVPVIWAWDKVNEYGVWLEKPYYSKMVGGVEKLYAYSSGLAWILRILSFVFLFACIAGACYGIYRLWLYYRKRWCNLSQRVLFASFGAIFVFGEFIRKYMSINLVLLLVIIQIAYLGILVYLDGYFENRERSDTWYRFQNT